MKKSSKILWGLLLIVVGVIYAVNATGIADIDLLLAYKSSLNALLFVGIAIYFSYLFNCVSLEINKLAKEAAVTCSSTEASLQLSALPDKNLTHQVPEGSHNPV